MLVGQIKSYTKTKEKEFSEKYETRWWNEKAITVKTVLGAKMYRKYDRYR